MRVIEDAWSQGALASSSIATIGNFDGIHRGQKAVLRTVVERAGAAGMEAAVITFEPHPRTVLRPETGPSLLTTPTQKRALLEAEGVDLLAVVRFDAAFAGTSAEDFVRRFLHSDLAVRELYVGSTFAFGRGREGDLALLRSLGGELGFGVSGVPERLFEDAPISSTRIRQAIRDGEMGSTREMLGRAYSITGRVERGRGMGQRLGWPTINVTPDNDLLPRSGVYVSTVFVPGLDRTLGGVTNVGVRPTFPDDFAAGSRRFVESHLLDFAADLYDEPVDLRFLEKLRDERAFPSAEELSRQIGEDAERAREYLRLENCLHDQPGGDERDADRSG